MFSSPHKLHYENPILLQNDSTIIKSFNAKKILGCLVCSAKKSRLCLHRKPSLFARCGHGRCKKVLTIMKNTFFHKTTSKIIAQSNAHQYKLPCYHFFVSLLKLVQKDSAESTQKFLIQKKNLTILLLLHCDYTK